MSAEAVPAPSGPNHSDSDHSDPDENSQGHSGLDDQSRRMLDFERQWWKYAGAKEQAIRELFDLSPTRYYQQLNALLDTPGALAYDPMLVKRLRRMRSARSRARVERLGGEGQDRRAGEG